jgi:hypothetical protein
MIRNIIHKKVDIYKDFIFDKKNIDLQGWGSDHPIILWAIEKLKPSLIIEVGSWKGRSAIKMAMKIKKLKLNSKILCIDTWLGSTEHWLGKKEYWDSLQVKHGRPNIYNTFLTNVIAFKCQKYIMPFSISSEAAFFILKKKGIKSSMRYIDAGHEYETVTKDLKMYWQLLKNNGVMIIDDYLRWNEVTKAVNNFCKEYNLTLHGENSKAVISKNSKIKIPMKKIF